MYKHIVFDIDGTLLNTEYMILHSLQDTLDELLGIFYETYTLDFTLRITGEATLKQLKINNFLETM